MTVYALLKVNSVGDVVSGGFYTERWPTTHLTEVWVELYQSNLGTFEDGARQLVKSLKYHPGVARRWFAEEMKKWG